MGSTSHLDKFASRVMGWMAQSQSYRETGDNLFNAFALRLFALQHEHNPAFRAFCSARGAKPGCLNRWEEIPALPNAAFKEFEVSCLPTGDRQFVFHSSGTSEQQPSRHFHNPASLQVYEASLLPWFRVHFLPAGGRQTPHFLFLTPPPSAAPHSSLVHMFEAIRRRFASAESEFMGQIAEDGGWKLDLPRATARLNTLCASDEPTALLGTAFSFVHLLDYLAKQNVKLHLPAGSRVFETGGYKGRSRALPKASLHSLIAERLGVLASHLLSEYGMSELSSQAYDGVVGHSVAGKHVFQFPPWARAQIVSLETGRHVKDGETGLIRVVDLANVYSALAIQTEDVAVRRGDAFELLGRADLAEPRGCSLTATA